MHQNVSLKMFKKIFLNFKKFNSENIIRITSDCPFINIYMIKEMILFYKK